MDESRGKGLSEIIGKTFKDMEWMKKTEAILREMHAEHLGT